MPAEPRGSAHVATEATDTLLCRCERVWSRRRTVSAEGALCLRLWLGTGAVGIGTTIDPIRCHLAPLGWSPAQPDRLKRHNAAPLGTPYNPATQSVPHLPVTATAVGPFRKRGILFHLLVVHYGQTE